MEDSLERTTTGSFPHNADGVNTLIPGWSALLDRWARIVTNQAWSGTADCSWWYGERASLSQLAGAAWTLADGWALQEYAGTRGDGGRGRIDLAIEAAGGLRSAVEAKQIWPRLSKRGSDVEDLHRDIEAALQAAEDQLIHDGARWIAEHDEYDLVAGVFVAPRLSPGDPERAARIASLTGAIATVPRTVAAWSFPSWARDVISPLTGDSYPGVALVARRVRLRVEA